MKIISTRLFKLREPKKFRYVPRYYDERKEKFKHLYGNDSTLPPEELDEKERQMMLRAKIEAARRKKTNSLHELKSRNLRLLIVLAGLLLLTYFAMKRYGLWEHFF